MKWFGLTGGIASGKSTVARMMVASGVDVIDADVVAREVVEPGEAALDAIVERFGSGMLQPDGRLDRAALGERVFGDDEERAALDAILHPAIAARSARHMTVYREAGTPFVVYDAALIVENQLHRAMDGLAVVDLPREIQLERLMTRDHLERAAAQARIEAQIDRRQRLDVATWIIDNSGTVESTRDQVSDVVADMCARAGVEPQALTEPDVTGSPRDLPTTGRGLAAELGRRHKNITDSEEDG